MRATIHFQTNQGNNPFRDSGTSRNKVRKFIGALRALLVGGILLRAASRPKVFAGKVHAFGTVVYGTASGAQTVVLNGVTVSSFSHGATDTADATTVAANINASSNALIQYLCEASNLAATFTLASLTVGQYVQIGEYKFTAGNNATLRADEFYIGAVGDTADATSLAAQINARAGLNEDFFASSSSGVVTVRQRRGTTALKALAKSGAGITLSGQLAATATVLVSSTRPGPIGNAFTLSVTGTGATASGARLTGGTEDVLTF